MIRRILALSAVAASLLMAGCASPGVGGANYTRAQTRGEQSVRLGTVESVRDVIIDADNTGTGSLAGVAIGGIAGSTVGGGYRANAAGAIVGAVVGGQGIEVTVRLEGGKIIAVTQGKDEDFRAGDRVKIMSGQGATRVSRL